jgi:hypothetical protein
MKPAWILPLALAAACSDGGAPSGAADPAPPPSAQPAAATAAPAAATGTGTQALTRATVAREEPSKSGEVRLYSAVIADLDADGKPELVAGGFVDEQAGRRSTVPIYTAQNGAWVRLAEAGWSDGRGSMVRNVKVADVDGDGRDDIVVLGRTGDTSHTAKARLAVLALRGGAVKHLAEAEWKTDEYTHGYGLDVGDLDGDGKLEIVSGGFQGSGAREVGYVRVWSMAGGALKLRAETILDGQGEASMRVNGIAVGNLDGGKAAEIVVAGRRGPLKTEETKEDHRSRTETGDLAVLALAGGELRPVARYALKKGTTARLRAVAVANLDGDARPEIVTGGQYDAEGKALLALFSLEKGGLVLRQDASSLVEGANGEVKSVFVDGDGPGARVITTGPVGDKPERQGLVVAFHLHGGVLVRDAAMVSRNGDETRSRAAVVVPGPGGPTVLTVGHARKDAAMVGQVLEWKLP